MGLLTDRYQSLVATGQMSSLVEEKQRPQLGSLERRLRL